jgi:hypothetical protein
MQPKYWWVLAVVLLGAGVAGIFLSLPYVEQQLPNESVKDLR